MAECRLCPRACGADRDAGEQGFCGVGGDAVVARAAPHFWEEPCISGTHGSGTVFFSGCSLRCVYCQNRAISSGAIGKTLSAAELRELFLRLAGSGVHNINLVTPTHFSAAIAEALEKPVGVPIVYNCGGYESVEMLKMLEGKIDVYLTDMKYSDAEAAARLSGAPDYFDVARAAVREMSRQVGGYVIDDEGIMTHGLIVRHLILPGYSENTRGVLRWFADEFAGRHVKLSLMSQYFPPEDAEKLGAPPRRLSPEEYAEAELLCAELGITDGYFQELDAASDAYVPPFDLTGV
ncbi:MAG: radical SAM protein [Oscillospiraceae bacterium]|nr:radical SAM protein [Oscillospiraceae bacterium]